MDPAVLELEHISGPWISRIGLKPSGCRVAIPLGIADGLDGFSDAAIPILGKRDVGIAITHLSCIRALPNIPLLKSRVVRIDLRQSCVVFPRGYVRRDDHLSSRCLHRG